MRAHAFIYYGKHNSGYYSKYSNIIMTLGYNLMELTEILERLRLVTGQKSDRAMCISLGLKESIAGAWKRRGTVPFEACFIAAKKTGYCAEWILYGEGPQKHGEPVPFKIDEENLITEFKNTLVDGVEFEIIRTGKRWNADSLDMLARKLYKRFTGFVSIPATEIKKDVI
jgi:hypothetical protein